MNDNLIEKLLSRAPRPSPPKGLMKKLESDITLPEKKDVVSHRFNGRQSPVRRWLPALAFTVLLLSCVVVIGMQANWVGELKRENETLRAAAANAEQLRPDQTADTSAVKSDEAEQSRKDKEELLQLRGEVTRLRQQAAQFDQLVRMNQDLHNHLDEIMRRGIPAPQTPALPEDKEKAESIQCVNNLKQIGLAVRIWSGDNNDRNPTSVLQMTNELNSPIILACPSDPGKVDAMKAAFRSQGWAAVPQLVSYQLILSGEIDDTHPQRIIAKCPIHGHVALADGSVQAGALKNGTAHEVTVDGRLELSQ
jgi:hypothetical protein